MKLRASGFRDLESSVDPDRVLSSRGLPSAHLDPARARLLEVAGRAAEDSDLLGNAKDRSIAREIASGASIRATKLKVRCGQSRIERFSNARVRVAAA